MRSYEGLHVKIRGEGTPQGTADVKPVSDLVSVSDRVSIKKVKDRFFIFLDGTPTESLPKIAAALYEGFAQPSFPQATASYQPAQGKNALTSLLKK